MTKSKSQKHVVASYLPAPPLPQSGNLPTADQQSDLIAAAVKDGISSALAQLLHSSAPVPTGTNLEVVVTTTDDILHNWKYHVDPTGDRTKRHPWVKTIRDKETGKVILAKVIIPPGLFGERMRPQGPTVEAAIENAKKAMLKQWAKDRNVAEMDARARGQFVDCQQKLVARGLPEKAIWTSVDEGNRIVLGRLDHKIPKEIDIVDLGIQLGINYAKPLSTWIAEYCGGFKPARRPSPRGLNTKTRTNARAILNRLEAAMIKAMGEKVSLIEIIKEQKHLTKFFHDNIHTATAGTIGARKRSYSELMKFFDHGANEMERPSLNAVIHGGPPKGIRGDVSAPKPDIIRKFLNLIEDEKPTFLPMATMVVFFARPQESYLVLEKLREFLKDEWIDFPLEVLKVGVSYAHTVRLRPAPLLWFARDPRWQDPKATDFRPRKKNGKLYAYTGVERALSRYMKKAGWGGDLTKEYLRKSFVSAQIAVGNNVEDILWELGHADLSLLSTYNARFTQAEGLAFFRTVPRGTANFPEHGFYEPVVSPRRGLNPVSNPDFLKAQHGVR